MDKQQKIFPNTLFELGYEAYKANKYDRAIDYFNQAVKSGLDEAALFVEIGVCVINITGGRNPIIGEGYFNRAIQVDPTYAMAYFNLGVIKLNNDEFEQAISYFDKSIEYNMPNVSFAYCNRASARLNKTINDEYRENVLNSLSKYLRPENIMQPYRACYNDIMKAIELTKAKDRDTLFLAGRICEKLERVAEARLNYTMAGVLGDNDAKLALKRLNGNTSDSA